MFSAASAAAQGTIEDYHRAYALKTTFSADSVFNWARNIAWRDSSHVLHYQISTPQGKQYVVYDADKAASSIFNSKEEMDKALGIKPRPARKPHFKPQRERHWMEVDEENDPRPVVSPDGKQDAFIEEYNVVIHNTDEPYSNTRRLTQDGTIGKYYSNRIQWSPDGKYVTLEYNQRGHHLYQLLAMDAATGQLRTVVEEKASTFVNYTRLWRQFINDGKQLLWLSERDNWNHLYLYDVKTSKVIRQITKGPWCVRDIQYVDEKEGTIYFSASGRNSGEDPYHVHYYKIGIDGKNLVELTPEPGYHDVTYSYDRRYIVDTYSTVATAPVTVLRNVSDGSLVRILETADISRLQKHGWVAPEVFVAKGRDGVTDMWGIIQRPTNFDPNRKYPVIEYIYAGPGSAYTPKSFIPYNWNMTSLAELGFIVVQLDAMGTSWRGKQFEEVCYKNLKDAGFPDRKLWIKAAADIYPYMDAGRVGIFGASAGGQESTTAVLLHGDFYKAAYSSCGCHDNRMDKIWWNEQWMSYPIDSSYVECSNVENAHKLERPLMLVVGEMDDNVDPSSTYQVVNALIKANKDFELVMLPGVHHTMGESFGEHKRYDFFVKHLLGVNPPKWNELK